MEGKLLKLSVILWRCWMMVIVMGDHFPSSASLPQLASPISHTTFPYSSWLQQSSLTVKEGHEQSSLTTSPGLQQSPLTTSPGLQQSSLTTSPGLQQSPLTTSPGPARSPRQHPPLASTRDVPLTGNTAMGETQSSGQNPLQPTVSHLYPDMTLLRRTKRKNCFNEGVRVSNNFNVVMYTDKQSGTLYFYPEDDFDFVRIVLSVTHGKQDGVFNKEDLCFKERRRWYTLQFSTYLNSRPNKADTWGIMVKVDNCTNYSPIDYWYAFNWFHNIRVVAKGSFFCSTRAPDPDCPHLLLDHTTAGGKPGSTHPSDADATQAGVGYTVPLSVLLTIVFSVTLVSVAIWYRQRDLSFSSRLFSATRTKPSAPSESQVYVEFKM